jgi:glycosyltransferase involved in cell wall biosynthesis
VENNKTTPKISVVMPVLNCEEYLSQAIESVINQSFQDFEFLIIYDDSTDNSLEIIESYALIDPKIKIIKGDNEGISGALNKGFDVSKGKFIARIDADDICMHDRFKDQIKYLIENDLDICGSHSILINNLESAKGFFIAPISHDSCTLALAFEVPFQHSSVIIKKDFIDKYDLRYRSSEIIKAEDYDLWIRMHKKGAKFGNINKALIKYREVDNSLSRLNNKNLLRDTKLLSNNFFKLNYDYILNNVETILKESNAKERILVARFLINNLIMLRFKKLSLLKHIKFKEIIYVTISEILKRFRFIQSKFS